MSKSSRAAGRILNALRQELLRKGIQVPSTSAKTIYETWCVVNGEKYHRPSNDKSLERALFRLIRRSDKKETPTTPTDIIHKPEVSPRKIPQKPMEVDPKTNEFLMTREWRELRYAVLKKYGAICQCCGRSRRHGVVIHVDHIKPRWTHPHLALDPDNLQVLCADCNKGKGAWDQTNWR